MSVVVTYASSRYVFLLVDCLCGEPIGMLVFGGDAQPVKCRSCKRRIAVAWPTDEVLEVNGDG